MPDTAIQWLDADGAGGALDERRRVLSIPGALPGDLVRWQPVDETARRVNGLLETVLTPSPARQVPTCPHDQACGGCDLSALRQASRHEHLARAVQRALQLDSPPPIVSTPDALGQRARIKLTVREGRVGYQGAGSHDLVEVERCEIAHPRLHEAHAALRQLVSAHPDPAFDTVELRTDGTAVVFAVRTQGRLAAATRAALPTLGNVVIDGDHAHGDTVLRLPHDGCELHASGESFFQVHLPLNLQLVRHVRDQIVAIAPERVVDLYAGIGNLGVPIARAGIPVVAVERDGTAVRDLEQNAVRLGLTRLTVRRGAVEHIDLGREPFDAAVLDPPRKGAGEVLGRVLRNRPRRVVYVACQVTSAARDLRAVASAGYRISSVTCFDLFPQTHHIETVLTLDRPGRA